MEPGRYRVRFALGADSDAYTGVARLLERVRHWRATEVREEDEPLSPYHAREMAWCASSQLKTFGTCQFRFYNGVLPRCSLCPLFDAERAFREGENPPPAMVLEIRLRPHRPTPPGRELARPRPRLAGSRLPATNRPLSTPPASTAAAWNASTVSRSGAANAMCTEPAATSCSMIQKS